jgi:hypothetical protein
MSASDERQVIRDAMDRLLNGTPIRSNGALNVVTLAEEAGVKRHLLTHRHTDLRAEFYDRVRSRGYVPQSEVALREEVANMGAAVTRLREEKAILAEQVALLRRMVNVLEIENAQAVEALRSARSSEVTSIFGGLPPRR